MTSPAARAWLSFLLVAIGLYGSYTVWKVYKANAIEATVHHEPTIPNGRSISQAFPTIPLDEFTFTDSEGQPFPLQSLSGKVWVASFFFATCPGFCLQMNQEIAKIVRDVTDQDVTFVSFTVDPEQDTPEALKEYAGRMQADPQQWIFLTGKLADIQELGQQYLKVPATKDHLDKLLLIGRDARVHGFFASRDPQDVKRLKQAIAESVAAKAPPTDAPSAKAAAEPSAEQPDSGDKVPE